MNSKDAHESPLRAGITVVVLAYNEAENVKWVLDELLDWLSTCGARAEVIVVDDGSRDRTPDIARERLHSSETDNISGRVVQHRSNRGMGAALKTGVHHATHPYVTFLPCDGQVPPSAIGALSDAAGAGADVVLSTYDNRSDGALRAALSMGVRGLIRVVHGVSLRSEGPYLFRRGLFIPAELASNTFFLNFEFPIRATAAKLEIAQTTVACRPRRAGHSKVLAFRRVQGVAEDLFRLRFRRFRQAWDRARG